MARPSEQRRRDTWLMAALSAFALGGCVVESPEDVAKREAELAVAATPVIGSIAAGTTFNCMLHPTGATAPGVVSGTVQCWGADDFGQLGDGLAAAAAAPKTVLVKGTNTALSDVRSISVGYATACAIAGPEGKVYCWGDDTAVTAWESSDGGDAGAGDAGVPATTTAKATLVSADATTALSGAVEIAVGYYHACALKTDGSVVCWGGNDQGQLGDGTSFARRYPVAVKGIGGTGTLTGVLSLTAGFAHTCARLDSGAVACWGFDANGQLGNGAPLTRSFSPVSVTLPANKVAVALDAGHHTTCAVTVDGASLRRQVFCWGANIYGQVGDGTAMPSGSVPSSAPTYNVLAPSVAVVGGDEAVSVSVGQYHACATTTSGRLSCWGHNGYGKLGANGTTNSSTAVVASRTDVVRVSAGGLHTCALYYPDQVRCVGNNSYLELGQQPLGTNKLPALPGIGAFKIVFSGGAPSVVNTCGTLAVEVRNFRNLAVAQTVPVPITFYGVAEERLPGLPYYNHNFYDSRGCIGNQIGANQLQRDGALNPTAKDAAGYLTAGNPIAIVPSSAASVAVSVSWLTSAQFVLRASSAGLVDALQSNMSTCGVGALKCDGSTCSVLNDTNNCGACGQSCAGTGPNPQCVSGACYACPSGQAVCGNTCSTLATDVNNCGACGNVCSGPSPACEAGVCKRCPTGTVECGGVCVVGTGCCSSTVQCNPGNQCLNGVCQVINQYPSCHNRTDWYPFCPGFSMSTCVSNPYCAWY